jgi:hypothetical protein
MTKRRCRCDLPGRPHGNRSRSPRSPREASPHVRTRRRGPPPTPLLLLLLRLRLPSRSPCLSLRPCWSVTGDRCGLGGGGGARWISRSAAECCWSPSLASRPPPASRCATRAPPPSSSQSRQAPLTRPSATRPRRSVRLGSSPATCMPLAHERASLGHAPARRDGHHHRELLAPHQRACRPRPLAGANARALTSCRVLSGAQQCRVSRPC